MLPDIKIAQINTFLTVAHCKNFRQAANILCRSQPAVSLAIKQLENLLGAALFNPERHGELSAFGIAFLPEAKALYKHYETAVHNGMSMAQGQSGSIKLGVLPSIAKTVLAHIMRDFLAQHPLVHLQVQDDNGDNLRDKILDGRIDLAISSIWQTENDLHHTNLCADRVGIVALKTHPWMAFPKDSEELAFRLIEEPKIKRQIALLQSRRHQHMPVTKALEQIIINTFKNRSKYLESPTQLIT